MECGGGIEEMQKRERGKRRERYRQGRAEWTVKRRER